MEITHTIKHTYVSTTGVYWLTIDIPVPLEVTGAREFNPYLGYCMQLENTTKTIVTENNMECEFDPHHLGFSLGFKNKTDAMRFKLALEV